jgi:hypothetical protein
MHCDKSLIKAAVTDAEDSEKFTVSWSNFSRDAMNDVPNQQFSFWQWLYTDMQLMQNVTSYIFKL